MLLHTNIYRKAETEQEPHNTFVDFSRDFSFDGPDCSFQGVNIQLPYPVGAPLAYPWKARDPVTRILEDKEQYKKALKACNKKLLDEVEDVHCPAPSGTSHYQYMPRRLLEVYQHNDPDEEFDCDYNLYYTNGILDSLELKGGCYLVCPKLDGEMQFLHTLQPDESFTLRITRKGPICCVRAYNFPCESVILLRLKAEVMVVKIFQPPGFLVAFQGAFQEPLIDAKLKTGQLLGVASLKGGLSIRELPSNKVIFEQQAPQCLQLEFWQGDTVLLMERSMIKLFDYREKRLLRTFDPHLMACNQLCNMRIWGDTLLLASRHYLVKMGLNEGQQGVATFGHTLSSAPLFMDVSSEFVCLGGHPEDSKTLFVANTAFGLPYKAPGLRATLEEAVLGSADSVIRERLGQRLRLSTAGLKLVPQGTREGFLYFANAIGEVFRQQISGKRVDELGPLERLRDWIKQLKGQHQRSLLYVTNFGEMHEAFTCLATREEKRKRAPSRETSRTRKFLSDFRRVYKRSRIKSTFGQGFLEVWSSEESEGESREVEAPDLPYYDKVSNWMEKHELGQVSD